MSYPFKSILILACGAVQVMLHAAGAFAQVPMLRGEAVSHEQVNLSWDRLPGGPELYEVERRDDNPRAVFMNISGPLPGNTSSYQDKTVQENRTYVYRVKAYCDKSCGGDLNEVTVTTPFAPPAAPGNLEASYTPGRGITVTWLANNGDGTRFLLERSANGGGFETIATLPYNRILNHLDASVIPGNRYCYRAKAVGRGGESGYSNEACANLAVPKPDAPSGLIATVINARQVDLRWTDNSDNEERFDVERSDDGSQFSKIGEKEANAIAFTDNGVQPRRKYWYRVVAQNGGGSSVSNVADANTPDVVPNTPRAVSATAVNFQQIDLVWGDVSDNEAGFQIDISTDGTQFTKLATTEANVFSYQSKNLNESTTYYYRVRAFNAIGFSEYSDIMQASTPKAPVPAKPTGLTAMPVDFDLIELKWNRVSANATTVIIERSRKPDADFVQIGNQAATTNRYPDREILDVYDYYYRIKAVNTAGASPYSDVVKVTSTAIITGNEPAVPASAVYAYGKALYIKTALPGRLMLVNMQGITVHSKPVSPNTTVDLSDLPGGIYIAVLETEKGKRRQRVVLH